MKLKKVSRARPNEAAKLQKVSPPNLVPTRLKKSRGLLVWSSVRWFGTKFAGPARTRFARFGLGLGLGLQLGLLIDFLLSLPGLLLGLRVTRMQCITDSPNPNRTRIINIISQDHGTSKINRHLLGGVRPPPDFSRCVFGFSRFSNISPPADAIFLESGGLVNPVKSRTKNPHQKSGLFSFSFLGRFWVTQVSLKIQEKFHFLKPSLFGGLEKFFDLSLAAEKIFLTLA